MSISGWLRRLYDVKYNGDSKAVVWELAMYAAIAGALGLLLVMIATAW